MRLFKARISPTGNTIDMCKPGWGHNLSFLSGSNGVVRFFIWVSTRPVVGDEVIWTAARGRVARGRVIKVEPAHGVWDMSCIDVDNIREEEQD